MEFRAPRTVRMTGLPQFPPVQSKSSRIVDVTVKPVPIINNINNLNNNNDNIINGGLHERTSRQMSSPVSSSSVVDEAVVRRLEEKIESLSDQINNLSNIHEQSINHLTKQLMITNKKLEIAQQAYADRQNYSPAPAVRTPEPIAQSVHNNHHNHHIPAPMHPRLHTPNRDRQRDHQQQRDRFRDQAREPPRSTWRMPPTATRIQPPNIVKLESAPMPTFNYYDRGEELDISYASEDYIKKHVLNKL